MKHSKAPTCNKPAHGAYSLGWPDVIALIVLSALAVGIVVWTGSAQDAVMAVGAVVAAVRLLSGRQGGELSR